eukprot:103462-Chlamydomonas_euryale.AAC.1
MPGGPAGRTKARQKCKLHPLHPRFPSCAPPPTPVRCWTPGGPAAAATASRTLGMRTRRARRTCRCRHAPCGTPSRRCARAAAMSARGQGAGLR